MVKACPGCREEVGHLSWRPAADPNASISAKKPRKAASGQKEMLMPIIKKKGAKEMAAKKPASKQRKSA
jgi:DNA end-binding protein Ku